MANTVAADDRPRHFSVPFGDGGNPSASGEERIVVMWSRAPLPIRSAHENGRSPLNGPVADPKQTSRDHPARGTIVLMRVRFYIDPATGRPHIHNHDVTEEEVEEDWRLQGKIVRVERVPGWRSDSLWLGVIFG